LIQFVVNRKLARLNSAFYDAINLAKAEEVVGLYGRQPPKRDILGFSG